MSMIDVGVELVRGSDADAHYTNLRAQQRGLSAKRYCRERDQPDSSHRESVTRDPGPHADCVHGEGTLHLGRR